MKFIARKRIAIATAALLALAPTTFAYGPDGHRLVGAIADQCLAKDSAGPRVRELLDGMTLAQASVLADSIKSWDRKGPDDPKAWHLEGHPAIEKQLRAFWEANPSTSHDPDKPSHHEFHYTDVPVATPGVKYADAKHGTSRFDIVHMIPYCVRVLKGEIPETNERKITRPVALILLAHYVGDIHQPLHVGAEYFTIHGPADPDRVTAYGDQGGNWVTLMLAGSIDENGGTRSKDVHSKLHTYWDNNTVTSAMRMVRKEMGAGPRDHGAPSDEQVAEYLAKHEPKGWKDGMKGPPTDWAEAWANEILPIARAAHERLEFTEIHLGHSADGGGSGQTRIVAMERSPQPDGVSYAEWSGKVVEDEVQKAGWRLAELCRKAL